MNLSRDDSAELAMQLAVAWRVTNEDEKAES